MGRGHAGSEPGRDDRHGRQRNHHDGERERVNERSCRREIGRHPRDERERSDEQDAAGAGHTGSVRRPDEPGVKLGCGGVVIADSCRPPMVAVHT